MANYYVRSGAGGAGTGADWANAFTTLTAALSGRTNADTLWVANDHSESTVGAVTLTCPTTPGLRILGVNTAVTEPPTGLNGTPAAIVAVGASSSAMKIGGFAYIYGITFRGGSNNSPSCTVEFGSLATATGLYLDNCAVDLRTIATTSIVFGTSVSNAVDDAVVLMRNSTFKFGATGQTISARGARTVFTGVTLDSAGSTPTTLFSGPNDGIGSLVWEASDLSGEAWTNIANVAWTSTYDLLLRNCKLPASTSLTTGTHSGPGGVVVKVHNCDDADNQNEYGYADYCGSVVTERTLVRTGGGAISFKMVDSGNTKFPYLHLPLEGAMRYTTTGAAKTITVEILHDSVTNIQDDEIWLEVIHQGTSGFPQGVLDIDDRMVDVFGAAADQTDSSETWTTTGMTNPNTQKLTCTFTPQEAGYVHFKVCLAKATAYTVYVDLFGASIA